VADQEPRGIGWIRRDPGLDRGIRIEDAAEGGLLLVNIVGGAGGEGIGARHLDQGADGLGLGGEREPDYGEQGGEAATGEPRPTQA
jgi:hypothetical protein